MIGEEESAQFSCCCCGVIGGVVEECAIGSAVLEGEGEMVDGVRWEVVRREARESEVEGIVA